MKKGILLLSIFIFGAELVSAQLNEISERKTISITSGTASYLGLSYMHFGGDFGLGLSFAGNIGTFSVNHADADYMKDGEIKDGGEYSWRYSGDFLYDRLYLTGKAFAKIAGDISTKSTWAYFGIGAGMERFYYGYERSAAEDIMYVNDETKEQGHTEIQLGIAWNSHGFYYSVGYSAINATISPQLTFEIGFGL